MKKRQNLNFEYQIAKFQPRQIELCKQFDTGLYKFLLYGGALGGGKSYGLRWFAVRFLMMIFAKYGLTWVNVMLACENYPALKDRQLQKISREFPDWLGKNYTDHKDYGRCFILSPEYGNGIICFRNLDDPAKYASSEFAAILVDELTKNDYDVFTFLRQRLRWPGLKDIECPFVGGTNPGSVGHGWVKALWMDRIYGDEWAPTFEQPIDYREQFCYIPSKADDNKYIDATYWGMLNTLPEAIRKAFRDGDWNVFVGQAFREWSPPMHVVDGDLPVPDNAPIVMTYDWGFGAPFSIGWWWIDNDGRVYRFDEWYGWNGSPNQGLRMTDTDIAKGIIAKEKGLGIWGRVNSRLAGSDCFQKRPNYLGGGQGPSTMEVFRDNGLTLRPADDKNRIAKIKQMHERLRHDQDMPMMKVYPNCKQFIRTLPNLVVDENNIEDVNTKGEDHCLVGSTIVDTKDGEITLQNLVGKSGKVLTCGGYWTDFYNCRKTREKVEVFRVLFDDDKSITCTEDHKILTSDGRWKEVKDLTDEACHVSIQNNKDIMEVLTCESKISTVPHKSLMVKGTYYQKNTLLGQEKGYIGQYGNIIMGKLKRVIISIIKTLTDIITKLKILNVKTLQSISRNMGNLIIHNNGLMHCMLGLTNGMEVKKDWNGTNNSTKNTVKTKYVSEQIKHVSFVKRFLRDCHFKSIVHEGVSKGNGNLIVDPKEYVNGVEPNLLDSEKLVHHIVLQGQHGKHAKVKQVIYVGEQDVFCLDAAYTHAFCVNGGITVHNCFDEAAHIAMSRPIGTIEKRVEPKKAPKDVSEVAHLELKEIWDEYNEINEGEYAHW